MNSFGKFVLTIVILAVLGFGAYKWFVKLGQKPAEPAPVSQQVAPSPTPAPSAANAPAPAATPSVATPSSTPSTATDFAALLAPTQFEVPRLAPLVAYTPKNNVVDVEISEYAGYAGLIVANGGMAPNENSIFAKKFGFKVNITLSEDENWSELNEGKIAASATTVDVLASYGKQFQAVVPAQIGFSRGADGVVVRTDIKRINDLKGKTIVTAQFTEADFFIRYLAQEAGISVNLLADLNSRPATDKLNMVFCADAFAAGDMFLRDVLEGHNRLAGCVTWAPKTTEVAEKSNGKARVLTTSVNLLIVADILVVNKGFAQQHPEMVAGLVQGLLEGNRMVRDNPNAHLDTIAKAFKWERSDAQDELAQVHLANLPENLAFFSGAIDAAGSFGGIYQSAVYAYGSDLIKDPPDSEKFADLKHLKAIEAKGEFKDQKIAIAPIRSREVASVENNPLLSKDIRFLFEPNSAVLVLNHANNMKNLEAIKQLLQVSPGSTVLLRGHVDNAMVEEFRKKGGDQFVRQMALKAMELSKNRAAAVREQLIVQHKIEPARLDTVGRGWDEPLGTDNEQNRRVEAQWFTLE
jgi:NitT/TauT family transport system substrate-binding protein